MLPLGIRIELLKEGIKKRKRERKTLIREILKLFPDLMHSYQILASSNPFTYLFVRRVERAERIRKDFTFDLITLNTRLNSLDRIITEREEMLKQRIEEKRYKPRKYLSHALPGEKPIC